MRKLLIPVLVLALAAVVLAQTQQPKWQVGTILSVAQHDPAQDQGGLYLYDMTVQIGDTVYVVLYDSPLDTELGRYKNGVEVTVLVGTATIKMNDIMGRTHDLPILSSAPKRK